MKSNQGNLEALAALCGTQSDAQMKDSKKQESREGSSSGAASSNASNNNTVSVPQAGNDSSNKANQPNPVQGLTQPQWQQALAAVSGLQQTHQNNLGSGMSPGLAQSLLLSGLSTQGIPTATAEQLALQRYLQQHASISAAQQAVLSHSLANYGDPNQALIMALTGKTQQFQQGGNGLDSTSQAQRVQQQVVSSGTETTRTVTSPATSSMQPPPARGQNQGNGSDTLSSAGMILSQASLGQSAHQKIAPMPGTVTSDESSMINVSTDNKRHQKRAANRKSAQLSRKRKKQYIEELKEENDELRRKEQILRSIPDMIVVFDSAGKLGFISQSFSTFLQVSPAQLEGSSFWERICHDSVRLLKAAFMDALAAREPGADTTPLGNGVWELRLLDKDSKYVVVTLNGVVHFTGDAPECVCCLRPSTKKTSEQTISKEQKSSKSSGRLVSSSDGSRSSDESGSDDPTVLRVNPNQSVMESENPSEDSNSTEEEPNTQDGRKVLPKSRQNVSDVEVSESSGSDDGITA